MILEVIAAPFGNLFFSQTFQQSKCVRLDFQRRHIKVDEIAINRSR